MVSARLVPISDPSALPVVRVGAILVELLQGSIYRMLMPRIIIFHGAQIALSHLASDALVAPVQDVARGRAMGCQIGIGSITMSAICMSALRVQIARPQKMAALVTSTGGCRVEAILRAHAARAVTMELTARRARRTLIIRLLVPGGCWAKQIQKLKLKLSNRL